MFNRRLPRIVLLIALLGAIAVVIAILQAYGGRTEVASRGGSSSLAVATTTSDSFRSAFLPLLERAVANADTLVTMGEARERNLFRIHAAQDEMNAALADADRLARVPSRGNHRRAGGGALPPGRGRRPHGDG